MNTQQSRLFQKLEIGVASPKQIRQWSERFLPNGETVGEVTSWETVNYKTLRPEPKGLFCQKTFGPVIDFTCACGKKSTKTGGGICPKCGVERTHSRVRRYRLGYIKLKQPVIHTLYASNRPSPVALSLNWSTKRLQSVMKTIDFCYLPPKFSSFLSKRQAISFFEKKGRFKEEGVYNFFLKEFTENTKVKLLEDVKESSHQFKKRPRLFLKSTSKKYVFTSGQSDGEYLRLYGVAYDATWRQVEDFQEFLFYLWEPAYFYEGKIPYYRFIKFSSSFSNEIPKHDQSYSIQTGGFAVQKILSYLDSAEIQQDLAFHYIKAERRIKEIKEYLARLDFRDFEDRKEIKRLRIKLNRVKQFQLTRKRQLELFRDFEKAKKQPAWMILSYLPVLPPGLRPISSIRGELIVSDINSLYRKVLIRNKRINSGVNFGVFDTALSGSWLSWCYNVRQVQEAVDELLKTGSVESGKPLKSLLDVLKGKQGRFRQHLLGKRVDYSGRSVIVVGPQLQIHQCGLPKQMAVELFQPFIIQKLRKKGIVFTTTAAKALIAERKPIIWSILAEILKTHPILLNRAPTLHRLGIQAFLPKLVEGKAILLHPLVCPAFNADFDGDQMAVHVPLSAKARAEAIDLLWARNHLLAPASGQPLLLPTQDMVLGFYYLTCSLEKSGKSFESLIPSQEVLVQNETFSSCFDKKNQLPEFYFSDFSKVKIAYDQEILTLHTPIWVKWSGFIQTFTSENQARTKELVMETRLTLTGRQESLFADKCQLFTKNEKNSKYVRTTTGRALLHLSVFDFS